MHAANFFRGQAPHAIEAKSTFEAVEMLNDTNKEKLFKTKITEY